MNVLKNTRALILLVIAPTIFGSTVYHSDKFGVYAEHRVRVYDRMIDFIAIQGRIEHQYVVIIADTMYVQVEEKTPYAEQIGYQYFCAYTPYDPKQLTLISEDEFNQLTALKPEHLEQMGADYLSREELVNNTH